MTKIILWVFPLGTVDPLPFTLPGLGITHKVFHSLASGDGTHRLSRAPRSYTIIVSLVVRNVWQSYRDQAQDYWDNT